MMQQMTNHAVLIAGGIGITPFRSLLLTLKASDKRIPMTLFYLARSRDEFIFKKELEAAQSRLGITIIYSITGKIPSGWNGESGQFSEALLKRYVTEYQSSNYYLAGPQAQVLAQQALLLQLGIDASQISLDSFTGYNQT